MCRRSSISTAQAEIATWARDEGPGWCRIENGAVTSAVLVHLRVEPAHFDWRWRGRPALARLAWETLARDPLARLRRIQVESIGMTINFRASVYHPSRHRSTGLATASRLALTAVEKIRPVSGPTGLRGHRRSPPLGGPKLLQRPGQLTRGDGVRQSSRSAWSGFRRDMSEGA